MATIASTANGDWSNTASWTGGVVPVIGDKVDISHTITVNDTSRGGGDDSSTAVNVKSGGTLKWSRTASSTLTVRGELVVETGGSFDMGKSADAIPVAYTATLKTNDSAALVDGKWGVTFQDNTGLWIYGAAKVTNTTLVDAVSIGATTADVADGTGWAVNDRVAFAATGTSATQQDVKTIATITPVSGTRYTITWVGGLTYAHAASAPVGNFTNNCVITPFNTTYRSYFNALWNTAQTASSREMRYVTFEEFATNTTGGAFAKQAALTVQTSGAAVTQPWISIGNIAFYQTLAGNAALQFGGFRARVTHSDIAIYGGSTGVLYYSGAVPDVYRCVTYKATTGHTHGYSEGCRNPRTYDSVISGCSVVCVQFNGSITPEYYTTEMYASPYAVNQNVANSALMDSCKLGSGTPGNASFSNSYLVTTPTGGIGTLTLKDCLLDAPTAVDYDAAAGYRLGGTAQKLIVANKNAAPNAQEVYVPGGNYVRDNTAADAHDGVGPCILFSPVASGTTGVTANFRILAPYDGASPTRQIVSGWIHRTVASGSTYPTVVITLSGLGIAASTRTVTISGTPSASSGCSYYESATGWEQFVVHDSQVTGYGGVMDLAVQAYGGANTPTVYLSNLSSPLPVAANTGEMGYWYNGDVAPLLMSNYASAGDIWNALDSTFTLPGSAGAKMLAISAQLPAALTADGNIKADMLRVNGTPQTAGDIAAAIAAVQSDLPQRITKNVALAAFPFFMVDSSDHVTGKTGLTVTATRSIDGAAFGACANIPSEISGGWYTINFANSDFNGYTIAVKMTAPGADPVNFTIVTQPT